MDVLVLPLLPFLFVFFALIWASSHLPHKDDPRAWARFLSRFRFGLGSTFFHVKYFFGALAGHHGWYF